jgi:predicted permease
MSTNRMELLKMLLSSVIILLGHSCILSLAVTFVGGSC